MQIVVAREAKENLEAERAETVLKVQEQAKAINNNNNNSYSKTMEAEMGKIIAQERKDKRKKLQLQLQLQHAPSSSSDESEPYYIKTSEDSIENLEPESQRENTTSQSTNSTNSTERSQPGITEGTQTSNATKDTVLSISDSAIIEDSEEDISPLSENDLTTPNHHHYQKNDSVITQFNTGLSNNKDTNIEAPDIDMTDEHTEEKDFAQSLNDSTTDSGTWRNFSFDIRPDKPTIVRNEKKVVTRDGNEEGQDAKDPYIQDEIAAAGLLTEPNQMRAWRIDFKDAHLLGISNLLIFSLFCGFGAVFVPEDVEFVNVTA